MKQKFLDSINYFACLFIGLMTFICIGGSMIGYRYTWSNDGMGSKIYRYNGFEFMRVFSGVDGAGTGIFGGVLDIFVLILGIGLFIFGLMLILDKFEVIRFRFLEKIPNLDKILYLSMVGFIALSLIALIMFAVCCGELNKTYESSSGGDGVKFVVGGGAISLFLLPALALIAVIVLNALVARGVIKATPSRKKKAKVKSQSYGGNGSGEKSQLVYENKSQGAPVKAVAIRASKENLGADERAEFSASRESADGGKSVNISASKDSSNKGQKSVSVSASKESPKQGQKSVQKSSQTKVSDGKKTQVKKTSSSSGGAKKSEYKAVKSSQQSQRPEARL